MSPVFGFVYLTGVKVFPGEQTPKADDVFSHWFFPAFALIHQLPAVSPQTWISGRTGAELLKNISGHICPPPPEGQRTLLYKTTTSTCLTEED